MFIYFNTILMLCVRVLCNILKITLNIVDKFICYRCSQCLWTTICYDIKIKHNCEYFILNVILSVLCDESQKMLRLCMKINSIRISRDIFMMFHVTQSKEHVRKNGKKKKKQRNFYVYDTL